MTGGEKAIGDVAVKGHHLSSGGRGETCKCQKKQ